MPASPSLLNSQLYASTSRERLKTLYSDFSRQKQSSPTSYEAKIAWWKRALECYLVADSSDSLVLHANSDLLEDLRVEGVGRPIGLNAVIAELTTSTSSPPPPMLLLATFLSLPNSIYSSRSPLSYVTAVPKLLLSYGVAKPLWWALEQVGVVGEDSITSSISSTFSFPRPQASSAPSSSLQDSWFGDYIALGLVEKAGQSITERQRRKVVGPGDALYSLDRFRREFALCIPGKGGEPNDGENAMMSELNMKVLLRYLTRDKEVVIVDGDVVKFFESYSLAEKTKEITVVDRGLVELKDAVDNLRRQTFAIQTKMEQCTANAAAAIKQNQKPLALSYLRSRRQLEGVLKKRFGALENLEGTLVQVEAAAEDIQIVKAYSTSTATLKAILSHPSLQRESVEQTMEAMAEANTDAKEIDEVIKIGGDLALGVEDTIDDEEIQNELAQLVVEAQMEPGTKVSELQEKLDKVSLVPPEGTPARKEAGKHSEPHPVIV
ncbi:hypothetical protein E1B28_008940 [Marasmius oreades]|uniref:Charged multivesicular body protein 7 n=1 Tax=Marasmius oreades TaxID=181124 RepID=A0A9P7US98_9AGAR|nr:uncharacterized protein E1B28_008940 [Marasmius oreades]KAG7092597.1 hypothetical protein E1B28_008940 [Marasmius oreades]